MSNDKYIEMFMDPAARVVMSEHSMDLKIHAKALAAHCECMAMNAENCISAVVNVTPPYNEEQFCKILEKWGIIDSEGKPLI